MNENTFDEERCVLCHKDFTDEEKATLVTRGLENLIKWSKTRKNNALEKYLSIQKKKLPQGKVLVHDDCRHLYVDSKRTVTVKRSAPSVAPSTPKKQKLCSSQQPFQLKVNCFYCDTKVLFDDKHPN